MTQILKFISRLLSKKRGHGCPYIIGETRNEETNIEFGKISFSAKNDTTEFFTGIQDPKAVIATPSGAFVAGNQLSWRLSSAGRTPSGSYIELVRNTTGSTDLETSVIVIGNES